MSRTGKKRNHFDCSPKKKQQTIQIHFIFNWCFSNYGWVRPLKKGNSQLMADETFLLLRDENKPERKPNLIKTEDWKSFVVKTFNDFLKVNVRRRYNWWNSNEAVFEKMLTKLVKVSFENPVFGKGTTTFVDELPSAIKLYIENIHHSVFLSAIHAFLKFGKKKIFGKVKW